jgi:UPF0755 protein
MRRGLLALGLLVMLTAGGAWFWAGVTESYTGHSQEPVLLDFPRGKSRHGMAAMLERNGIVRSRYVFEIYARLHRGRALQAGEYEFGGPASVREVFWKIAQGQVYVHTVVIPEGWTMFDIAAVLEREGLFPREAFLEAARNPEPVKDLAPEARTLEGFLFPASYGFTKHETAEGAATAMTERFRETWKRLSGGGAAPPEYARGLGGRMDAEKVAAMASLVERETPKAEERAVIAGVFANRLESGLPLQCDPTVQYALELAGQPKATIDSGDLRFKSPYNTYMNTGLPPGPIANPGEGSLEAAMQPAKTDYLYFVANDEGGHFFSRTLAEHNRNVRRYRRRLRGGAEMPAAKHTVKKKRGGQP